MLDEPKHRPRRRSPIQVEPLEGRALLSALKATIPPPQAYLRISPPSQYSAAIHHPASPPSGSKSLPTRSVPVYPHTTVPVYANSSSPETPPPTITGVHLVTQGRLASAVVLGFSKPMERATVENIHNYRILSRPVLTSHKGFLFSGGTVTTQIHSFPIAAANYDPSTSTVMLTMKRSARESSLYEVSSALPLQGHELTDSEGRTVVYTLPDGLGLVGGFTNLVHPIPGVNPFPADPLKTIYHTDSPLTLNPFRGFA